MPSNPIALFGSSSTAGGFTHAIQVNQNDPRSTLLISTEETENYRTWQTQGHPKHTNTSSCVGKFSTNSYSYNQRYTGFIQMIEVIYVADFKQEHKDTEKMKQFVQRNCH